MLIANLIDLDDFSGKLRELGVALPVGAQAELVSEVLSDWLNDATREDIAGFERLSMELGAREMMLPSVVVLLEQAHDCIDTRLTSIMSM